MPGFITLADVKAHANVTDSSHDNELGLFAQAAQEHVEALIGPVDSREVVETAPAGRGTVILSTAPVLSVTSVETTAGTAVTGYTLNPAAGLLTGVTVSGDVVVTYTAGRSIAPHAVVVAALIIAEHLWQTQRGNAASALPVNDLTGNPIGLGYAIPNRALELLSPYLLGPSVA